MRLSDFEVIVKDVLNIEIYTEDIDNTWNFWGDPKYLAFKDFDSLLKEEIGEKPKLKRF